MDPYQAVYPVGKIHLVQFDAAGRLRSAESAHVMQELARLLKSDEYTDVVVITHGYNNKQPSAELAQRVVPSLQKECPAECKPLYVAVSWPSHPETLFEKGAGDGWEAMKRFLKEVKDLIPVPEVSDRSLDATAPKCVVHDVEKEAERFIAEEESNSAAQGTAAPDVMSSAMRESVAQLVNELEHGSAAVDVSDAKLLGMEVDADHVETRYQVAKKAVEKDEAVAASTAASQEGGAAAFAVPLVPIVAGAVGVVRTAMRAWKILFALQDLLFGVFERRATLVGGKGVHEMLITLMGAANERVRFSAYGHSLGAHVTQSAAIGLKPPILPRKLHTLLLAQGACTSEALDAGGLYRPLVSQLRPVAGPIVATTNRLDPALLGYDAFLPTPLGRYGFSDPRPYAEVDYEVLDLEESGGVRVLLDNEKSPRTLFRKQTCYSLECRTHGIIEGHGDIQRPEVSGLFWQAVLVEVSPREYTPTDVSKLPSGYWDDLAIRSESRQCESENASGRRCTMF